MAVSYEQNKDDAQKPDFSRSQILLLSLMSGVVYVFLAWTLYLLFYERSLITIFYLSQPLTIHGFYGTLFGVAAVLLIGGLFLQTRLYRVLTDYEIVRYLLELQLRPMDALQISVVAGVSEEILFRGAIQPLLGIWWTSVLFVGLHGYFKWDSWKHGLFGLSMFGLSVGLGYLFREIGIYAAMIGHAVYDFLMLMAVNALMR